MINKAWLRPQWQPIDYSQAEAGNAPFDREVCLVKAIGIDGEMMINFMRWNKLRGSFYAQGLGAFPKCCVTHWMPVPEFLKG